VAKNLFQQKHSLEGPAKKIGIETSLLFCRVCFGVVMRHCLGTFFTAKTPEKANADLNLLVLLHHKIMALVGTLAHVS
jgi:hypothetical protein